MVSVTVSGPSDACTLNTYSPAVVKVAVTVATPSCGSASDSSVTPVGPCHWVQVTVTRSTLVRVGRLRLADWMSRKDNPFFAKALVNRYWKHFFSRGLVEPEDDMRETNPAVNPELLDGLAQHFIKSSFDMKDLIRTI